MSRILVTGGAGYIGSVATKMLLDANYEVTVLDDCSTGHADAVDSRASFIQGSILEKNAVLSALAGCESVMHFAGKSLVGESVENPNLYITTNVHGTATLLESMKESGIRKIVFSSSAATYGEPLSDLISEDAPTNPTNPYGQTKLDVDRLLADAASSDGIAAISLRYFNVAGALKTHDGWLGERHDPETHLIPNILKSNSGARLKIFGTDWPTPDGTCIRDYIHVVDLIEAHIAALKKVQSGSHQIINLGSGEGYSVRQVMNTASAVLGREVPYEEVGRRAGDPAILVASIAKAEEVLEWRPTRNLESIVSDAYQSSM